MIKNLLSLIVCTLFINSFAFAQTVTLTTPGNGTFTVPCDVTSITVEAWGAGGAGGGDTQNNAGGGGGGAGGAYATSILIVTPGQIINYNIGAGGNGDNGTGDDGEATWFNGAGILYAQGGEGGDRPRDGRAGGVASSAASIGDTVLAGTNGANGLNNISGAGGNGANGGGAGGTAANNGDGNSGFNPGGGGSGADVNNNTNRDGGDGGDGQIIITYTSSFQTYCTPTFNNAIEPITNVTFAGINNTTSEIVNGSPALESFCDTATVIQGSTTNPISLKGNTDGAFINYFRVYIDWNQTGGFGDNANEIYDIGTIYNSDGLTTGTPATLIGNINVPASAIIGNTSMRVMKRYNSYSTSSCQTGGGYGQAEDYIVNVTPPGPPNITSLSATSGCVGDSLTITGTNLSGATSVTIGGTTATITNNTATTITVTVGAGTSGTVQVTTPGGSDIFGTYTVNTLPANPNNPTSNSPQCSPNNVTITQNTSDPVGPTYYWQTTATGTSTTNNASTPLVVNTSGTYYIRAYNGNCWSNGSGSITITINPTPTITSQPATPAPICSGSGTRTLTVNATGATTYQWQLNGVNVTGGVYSGNTTNTLTITNPTIVNAGNYTVIINGATCPVTSNPVTLTVNPTPTNPNNPTSNSPQCNPSGVTITQNTSDPVGPTYYWQTTATGTSTANIASTPWVVNSTGTYYIRAYNGTCWSNGAGSIAVVVNNPVNSLATNPNPTNTQTNVCYDGDGVLNNLTWNAAAGASSYDIYFGTNATPPFVSNQAGLTFNPGVLLANTTYYWRVVPRNICGETTGSVTTWNFTTATLPCYCIPSVSNNNQDDFYINNLRFLGTLNDVSNLNTSYSNNPRGYQNFTGLPNKSMQAQGEGINISFDNNDVAFVKAWVDWNNDGYFNNTTEIVYDISIRVVSSTFGFVIPPATPVGDYRLRIRISDNTSSYNSCGNTSNGETEDYLFSVIASCSAKITSITNGDTCGPGTVNLSVTGSAGVTQFNWYDSETGGNLVATTPTGNWTTPSITTTTSYFVTAVNGCESLVRTEIVAKYSPVPNLTVTPPVSELIICGENDVLEINATGDIDEIYLFNENFEAGNLGVFTETRFSGSASSEWQNEVSTYIPNLDVWFPAISSGFGTNNFVMSNADTNATNHNALNSPVVNSNTFTNLTLDFRMYYSHYTIDNTDVNNDYVSVQVSTNGGTTWPNEIIRYTADVGIGTRFAKQSFDLTAYINEPNLRIRFRFYGDYKDGVALDDIKLYGDKDITAVDWSTTPVGIISLFEDAAGATPYTGGAFPTIYAIPNLTQLEEATYDFTIDGMLANGCGNASLPFTITNNSKVWRGDLNASSEWDDANNWRPNGVPTSDNCVIITSVCEIPDNGIPIPPFGYEAFAKNLTIKPSGDLRILSNNSLTVTEWININTNALFDINDDASLVQINNVTNLGIGEVKRSSNDVRDSDYIYWSSPVTGFNVNSIPTAYRYAWLPTNPSNTNGFGSWINASGVMTLGRGYIVRAGTNSSDTTSDTPVNAVFNGVLNNGDINTNVSRGNWNSGNYAGPSSTIVTNNDDNWNLIGNPYPSAIDAKAFLTLNTNIEGAIHIWTHNTQIDASIIDPFYEDFGYNYSINDYVTYNLTGANTQMGYNGKIASGQGFFVLLEHTSLASDVVTFNNSMRDRTYDNSQFFRTSDSLQNEDVEERHRIWLNLISSTNEVSSTLVGYIEGATLEKDRLYDAYGMEDNAMNIYSKINDESMIIQGRPLPFNEEDQVPLGVVIPNAGNYTIGIVAVDGLFINETQSIFLEDLELGFIHDLRESPYNFTANNGNHDDRFILRYTNEALGVNQFAINSGIKIIAPNGKYIKVISGNSPINNIIVYDLLGRILINKKDINTLEFIIDDQKLPDGTYVVKATLTNGKLKTKKVILNH